MKKIILILAIVLMAGHLKAQRLITTGAYNTISVARDLSKNSYADSLAKWSAIADYYISFGVKTGSLNEAISDALTKEFYYSDLINNPKRISDSVIMRNQIERKYKIKLK